MNTTSMKESNNVVVIGGGAAGMMAAGTAASLGAHVTLLEPNAQGDPCQHTQKQDQSPRGHVRQQLAHDGKRRDAGCNRAQRLHDFDVAA